MKNTYHFILLFVTSCLISCSKFKTFYGKNYYDLKETNSIYRLDLSNYKEKIELNEFDDLRVLNLSNIQSLEVLIKVINTIPNPEKIKVLILNNNNLKELPKNIKKLTGLKQLSLHKNPELNLISSFHILANLSLEFLDLQFNDLEKIPKEINLIKTLEELNLSSNHFSDFSFFHHLSELTNLKSLWLRNNNLTYLHEDVNKMTQLINLYLENNQIKQLPDNMSGLISLRVLHLSFNNLQVLPESIQTIPRVILLHVDHCKIKKIPESFNLKTASFKGLVINDNDLSPIDIRKWKSVFKSFFLLIF